MKFIAFVFTFWFLGFSGIMAYQASNCSSLKRSSLSYFQINEEENDIGDDSGDLQEIAVITAFQQPLSWFTLLSGIIAPAPIMSLVSPFAALVSPPPERLF